MSFRETKLATYTPKLHGRTLTVTDGVGFKRSIGVLENIDGKLVLVCHRNSKEHFMRKLHSWLMAECAIDWLALHGVSEIHIVTKKHVLVSELWSWQTKGVAYHHPDFESQTALHKSLFKQRKH